MYRKGISRTNHRWNPITSRSGASTTATSRSLSIHSRYSNPFTRLATNNKNLYCFRRNAAVQYSRNTLDPCIEEYLLSLNLLDDANDEAKQRLHFKIVKSLEVFYGKGKVQESHLQFFGKDGIKSLANAILREDAATKLHPSPENTANSVITVRFVVPHHNTKFDLPWHFSAINADGQTSSLLDLRNATSEGAALLAEYIEASCGGNCSCSTCHVYVDTSPNSKTDHTQMIELSSVTDAEQDMLDLAYQPTDKSRLACQVRLLKLPPSVDTSNGPLLTVTIPSGVNDLWK